MSATDRSLLDLGIKENFGDSDTIVSVVSGQVARVKFGSLVNQSLQWSNIRNKPFDGVNSDDFTISASIAGGSNVLSLNPSITQKVHEHTNKSYLDKISEDNNGKLLYNNLPVTGTSDWENLLNKPFESLSENDFIIDENSIALLSDNIKNQLHTHDNYEVIDKFSLDTDGNLLYNNSPIISDSVDFTSLSAMLIAGNNISITTDESAKTITFSASGMDFFALSESLTTGVQSGISITADTVNNRINFEVTGIPEVTIDSEGYWTIDGLRGDNPTKAQGENGANGTDGITPSINTESKNWFIGETDTGVRAEGNDGYSPSVSLTTTETGVEIDVTNKDGIQHATILNGQNGVTTIQTSKVDKTCVFTAANWSDTVPYTQTVSVEGLTEALNPRIDVIISDNVVTGKKEEIAFSYLTRVATGDGILTAYCYETKPDVDLNIMIEVI